MIKRLLTSLAVVIIAASLAACGQQKRSPVAAGPPPTPALITMSFDVTDGRSWKLQEGKPSLTHYSGTFGRDGSFRVEASDNSQASSWDAETRKAAQWSTEIGTTTATVTTNTPYGSPDFSVAPLAFQPFSDLTTYVLAQRSRVPSAETSTTVNSRSATRMNLTLPGSKLGEAADHAEVVVDDETGLPFSVQMTRNGSPFYAMTTTDFTTRSSEDSSDFDVSKDIPAKAETAQLDENFQKRDDAAAWSLHYAPFSAELPLGWTLAGTVVHSGTGKPTGAEGMNPPGQDVVSMVYVNGWQRAVVTTRHTAGVSESWGNPFAVEGVFVEATPVSGGQGQLHDATGEVAVVPGLPPFLWAKNADFVFTTTGPLTQDQLSQILATAGVKNTLG